MTVQTYHSVRRKCFKYTMIPMPTIRWGRPPGSRPKRACPMDMLPTCIVLTRPRLWSHANTKGNRLQWILHINGNPPPPANPPPPLPPPPATIMPSQPQPSCHDEGLLPALMPTQPSHQSDESLLRSPILQQQSAAPPSVPMAADPINLNISEVASQLPPAMCETMIEAPNDARQPNGAPHAALNQGAAGGNSAVRAPQSHANKQPQRAPPRRWEPLSRPERRRIRNNADKILMRNLEEAVIKEIQRIVVNKRAHDLVRDFYKAKQSSLPKVTLVPSTVATHTA